VLAPNQRPLQWDQISKVTKPFLDPKSNEFGFWFNYFWAQATTAPNLTHAQKAKIQEVFLTVFQPDTTGGYSLRADYTSLSSSAAENVLRQLLLIGFRRVAISQPPPATRLSMASFEGQTLGNRFRMAAFPQLVAQDARDLNFIKVVADSGRQLNIGFRADARNENELAQGFVVRSRESTDSDEFKKYALDQPWHPFNNPVYKESLFLRIGKDSDNCLNTVISVGQHLNDISHFPILADYVLVWNAKGSDGQFLAIKPFNTWSPEDVVACEAHWRKVKVVKNGNTIDHLEKQNFMYVFHTTGLKGVNTFAHFQSRGDAFNERGMHGVPRSHLLAVMTFRQKWYYRAENECIVIYEVEFEDIRWLQGTEVFDVLLGIGGKDKVEAAIRAEISLVAAKYAAEKSRKENPPASGPALSQVDRASITAKLGELYNSNKAARGNFAVEKRYVSEKLPALASRIATTKDIVWTGLRPKPAAPSFGPPPPKQ